MSSEVDQDVAVNTLMCQEKSFILNSGGHTDPVQAYEDGCDVLMFVHSHQHPSSTVGYLLNILSRDPDEKCVVVVQLGGDRTSFSASGKVRV